MSHFAKKAAGKGPPPTFLCRNRKEVTRALAAIREHMGLSQLDVDDIAGFCTGYTGKLERHSAPGAPGERPSGRSAINAMFDPWVGALKVGMILVPLGAEADIASARLPDVTPPPMTVKRAERIRALHRAGEKRLRLAAMFECSIFAINEILADRAFRPVPKL